jgi:uncharacterized membrane protein HdeD (DUF308 family)
MNEEPPRFTLLLGVVLLVAGLSLFFLLVLR